MQRYGSELTTLYRIKPDGSGTDKNAKISKCELYKLNRLSISKDTYIASGFNTFIVRLKNPSK